MTDHPDRLMAEAEQMFRQVPFSREFLHDELAGKEALHKAKLKVLRLQAWALLQAIGLPHEEPPITAETSTIGDVTEVALTFEFGTYEVSDGDGKVLLSTDMHSSPGKLIIRARGEWEQAALYVALTHAAAELAGDLERDSNG